MRVGKKHFREGRKHHENATTKEGPIRFKDKKKHHKENISKKKSTKKRRGPKIRPHELI